jgi:hypothetical protein
LNGRKTGHIPGINNSMPEPPDQKNIKSLIAKMTLEG